MDSHSSGGSNASNVTLTDAVVRTDLGTTLNLLRLFPTPKASDGEKGGPNQRGSSGDLTLPSAAAQNADRWGVYAAAVHRWEQVFGAPAPAPTEPGQRRGSRRLSPAFVEWLMGIPSQWVTGIPGLSHSGQLKMLGNGVVPQQAEHAIRLLLARVTAAEGVAA